VNPKSLAAAAAAGAAADAIESFSFTLAVAGGFHAVERLFGSMRRRPW